MIEDLEYNIIEVQREVVAELRLLAKYNMENRIIIANCGAIRALIALLHSSDLKTQENVVTALLNLSINENKNEIVVVGAVDPLINWLLNRSNRLVLVLYIDEFIIAESPK